MVSDMKMTEEEKKEAIADMMELADMLVEALGPNMGFTLTVIEMGIPNPEANYISNMDREDAIQVISAKLRMLQNLEGDYIPGINEGNVTVQ